MDSASRRIFLEALTFDLRAVGYPSCGWGLTRWEKHLSNYWGAAYFRLGGFGKFTKPTCAHCQQTMEPGHQHRHALDSPGRQDAPRLRHPLRVRRDATLELLRLLRSLQTL